MEIYKKLYFKLFCAISDVIETLENLQRECEEIYINSSDEENE